MIISISIPILTTPPHQHSHADPHSDPTAAYDFSIPYEDPHADFAMREFEFHYFNQEMCTYI